VNVVRRATVAPMTDDAPARERWNARYGAATFEPFGAPAAAWLEAHRPLLLERVAISDEPAALDVACGDGRNARLLAELGFAVDAVDVSDVAVDALNAAAADRGLRIAAQVVDLEHEPLPARRYDAVVCMNFLQRDLFEAFAAALRPAGLLIVETFARAHIEELGRSFNPAYVLERNELLRTFADLYVRSYREGVVEGRGGERGVAGIVAQRLPRC
jgi:tellurite methyltransferase